MEIKDLKVGMKFYKWVLGGWTVSIKDGIPEELQPFFGVFVIEKVNKVTFYANGMKLDSVPDDWHLFDIEKMKTTVRIRGKRYMSNVDSNGEVYCSYYMKHYTNYFKTLSAEEREDHLKSIDMLIDIKLHDQYQKKKRFANDKAKLYLGLREKEWNE